MLFLVSHSTFASRARVLALGNSFHLLDPYTAYGNPLDIANLGKFIVFDSGSTDPIDAKTNAEAMVSWTVHPKIKMALSLGHQDDSIINSRMMINAQAGTNYALQQNPIDLFYTYSSENVIHALSVNYSSMSSKTTGDREHSSVISYGLQIGAGQIYGKYGIINTAELTAGKKFDGAGFVNLAGRYGISSFTLGFDYFKHFAKSMTGQITDENHNYELIQAGFVDTRAKEGEEFFYGAQLKYLKANCRVLGTTKCDRTYTRTTLPIWIGFEVAGNQWLTFRGFLKQHVLVDQMKDEAGYAADVFDQTTGVATEYSAAPNSTELSTGLGINFGKASIDTLFKGIFSSDQDQSTTWKDFISTISLTYNY